MSDTVSIPTLNHLFFHILERSDQSNLLSWRDAAGRTVEYSTTGFSRAVFALYRHLQTCGLAPGDRVAIFAQNRPEWHIAEFALLLARMVVVPIYPTLAPAQVRFLLEHSGCRAVILGGRERSELLRELLPDLPELRWLIGMDEKVSAPVSLPELIEKTTVGGFSGAERAACLQVDPQSVATIVYTSGTTARPKGVMLSHANLTFDLRQCLERLAFRTTKRALSVLPLPHVFERLLCYGYLRMGISIAYGNPHDLKQLLALYHPQVMGCVPRVLEKIHEAIEAQLLTLPSGLQRMARGLITAATEDARARSAGDPVGMRLRLTALAARRLAAPRIRRRLGGIENFICGGAWLDPQIELFFRALGFVVLQGYGMTETSPVITLSAPGGERLGSVGQPLDGVEVRLSSDGEILLRGANVMLGYYRDPGFTGEVLREGWLATGDLGRMDADRYLYVTGRAKEIVVLSNGKKVFCPVLEQAAERSRYVRKVFLVGHGRKFPAALLVPHLENLQRRAADDGLRFSSPAELLALPEVAELVLRDVDVCQAEFSRFEQIKRFCFIAEDDLTDPELTTPTQKVRRDRLEAKFAGEIERMYTHEPASPADPVSASQQRHAIEEIHG
jgi:long-chain acyl-CoA synthetase